MQLQDDTYDVTIQDVRWQFNMRRDNLNMQRDDVGTGY